MRAVMITVRCLAVGGTLVVITACGSHSPAAVATRPRPSSPPTTSSSSTTTTTTTPTTTTTSIPRTLVPGPVKLGSVCTVPDAVSATVDRLPVLCIDHKTFDAKPFAGAKFRWIATN